MADVTSQAQDEWVEICAAVRAGLAKQAQCVGAMTPDEVAALVNAVDTAMWNEAKAASHDQEVEARRADMERQAAYGG
jgi:hypothetical protein